MERICSGTANRGHSEQGKPERPRSGGAKATRDCRRRVKAKAQNNYVDANDRREAVDARIQIDPDRRQRKRHKRRVSKGQPGSYGNSDCWKSKLGHRREVLRMRHASAASTPQLLRSA
jgi:hypothetical protein